MTIFAGINFKSRIMIQRIQSVYLFLAVVALVVMYFLPIASFYGDMSYFSFKISGLSDETYVSINTIPLMVMMLVLIILISISIFLYHDSRRRMMQIRMIRFGILLDLSFIIVLYFGYIDTIVKQASMDVGYKAGIYFPIIVLVFLLLAMRGVMNDEKKIRAADRLR
jgi:hypothetical protein